jgi:hypothetical protein
VHDDANPVNGDSAGVIIAVERPFRPFRGATSIEGEELQTSKREPKKCPSKDKEQDKIVTLGESDWVIDFAGRSHKTVCRRADCHVAG